MPEPGNVVVLDKPKSLLKGQGFCVAPLGLETIFTAYPPLPASPLRGYASGVGYLVVAPTGARDQSPVDLILDF